MMMASPFENDPDFIDEAITVRELEAENDRLREALQVMKKPPQMYHGIIDISKETDE